MNASSRIFITAKGLSGLIPWTPASRPWRVSANSYYSVAAAADLIPTTTPTSPNASASPTTMASPQYNEPSSSTTTTTKAPTLATAPKPAKAPRKFRARKAAMSLTPAAVSQLRQLLEEPQPRLIKVGVKQKGCSGLAYNLEFVEKPSALDEEVVQDGVKVLIDSKALFSIIGSEMDWVEDKLQQRFVFRNPNIKEQCGCGESFMV